MKKNQNEKINFRIDKEIKKTYKKKCEEVNSLMSIRIKKFIQLDILNIELGNDLLKTIENESKKH